MSAPPMSTIEQVNLAKWLVNSIIKSKVIMFDDMEIVEAFQFPVPTNHSTMGGTVVASGLASLLGIVYATRYNSYIALGASAMPIVGHYAYRGYSLYRVSNIKQGIDKLTTNLKTNLLLNVNIQKYSRYRYQKIRKIKAVNAMQLIEESDMTFYTKLMNNLSLIIVNLQQTLKYIIDKVPSLSIYLNTYANYDVDILFEDEQTIDKLLASFKNLSDLFCLVASAFLTGACVAFKLLSATDELFKILEEYFPQLLNNINYIIVNSKEEFENFRSQTDCDMVEVADEKEPSAMLAPLASIAMHTKLATDISLAVIKTDNEDLDLNNLISSIRDELTCATEYLDGLQASVVKHEKLEKSSRPASSDTESYNTAVAQSAEEETSEQNLFEATGELSFFSADESLRDHQIIDAAPENKEYRRLRKAVVTELKDRLRMLNTARGIVTEQQPIPPLPSDILSIDVPMHIRAADADNSISLSEAVSAIAQHMQRTEEIFEDNSSEN